MFKKLLPFIIVLILSYFTIKPLFLSGFFPMHDDTQVARVYEMQKSLADGMFPVRWVADLGYGYGYPIFNFYAPLAYYVGGLINLIGFDALFATKIMMGLGMVLAGFFMYLFAKEFWGRKAGLVAAIVYLYAPYHALDLYVRGDVAELWAYAFVPLAFYGLWNAYAKKKWLYVVIGSVGYAGIILSHNLTAMMITPFFLVAALLFYIYAKQEKTDRPHYPLVVFFIGILLAAFYWLPVFSEMKYTNVISQIGGGADYKDHFVCIGQLWDSPWGFGGSTGSCIDGLSFKIGKLHIIFGVISLFTLGLFWKSNRKKFGVVLFSFGALLFSLFLTLQPSQFIWDRIPQMAFVQYPWRFLLVASFFISFLGAGVVWLANKYISSRILSYLFVGLFLVGIIYINVDVFVPQMYLHKTATDYTKRDTLRWVTSKISDEYMPPQFMKPINIHEVPQDKIAKRDGIVVQSLQERTQSIKANITTTKKTDVLVNQAYFPGWHVYIDGQQSYFKYFNRGLFITLPQGTHTVLIQYSQTSIEKVANALSLAGVLLIIVGIIGERKIFKHAKKSA